MAATKPAGTAVAKAKINLPFDLNEKLAAEAVATLKSRIAAPSGDRISITQSKTFKMVDGAELEGFEGIVIDFIAANFYYTEAYSRDNIVPPKCFSLALEPASMMPSINSPEPQAGSCASCWANQFGSSGKGKACQNTRLLAIIPTDADVDTPISIMKISPTSLRAFDAHVGAVARKRGMPIRAVTTKFAFSEDSYSSVRFSDQGLASKELVIQADSRMDEAMQRLMVEPNVTEIENAGNKVAPARGKQKPPAKRPAAQQGART